MLLRQWVIPILTFAAITAWWLFPVLSNLSAVVPGAGAGDNVSFVWNVWWMRYVLHHSGQTFFFTPFLFHPIGVDLTLHTHTALPALIGAAARSPIAGQNAVIVLHVYLNFLCSYVLARRVTRQVMPSMAAALIFGTSTFVGGHLNGHFNLIAAWTLPLASTLTLRARESGSSLSGVLVAVALAATAYTDYYLFVYAALVVAILWISPAIGIGHRAEPAARHRRWRRPVFLGLISLLILDALVIAAILLLSRDSLDLGPIHMSLRSVRNPITAAWMLSLAAAAVAASRRMRITVNTGIVRRDVRAPAAALVAGLVLLTPLLIHAAGLWRAGGYLSQAYHWRSGPAGIDAATLFLGSPFHALWNDSVRGFYGRLHIDLIESSGSIPLSAIALAIAAMVLKGSSSRAPWMLTGTVFTLWALGPWLTAFGRQTPLVLPAILLRFVPVIANARIPGRAMVVVYLAIAMLSAIGLARLAATPRTRIAAWCIVLLLIVECIPARPPVYTVDIPSKYLALHDSPNAGAVCELPMGLRDGFGEEGSLDEAVLLHQTVHERPIVGGFVARLPPAIARKYQTIPVLRTFLRLSSGDEIAADDLALTPAEAAARLMSAGIKYVVLDVRRASPDLVRYVPSAIDLRNIGEENGRIFYEVLSPSTAH